MKKWIKYDNVARKQQWIDMDKSPQPDPKAELHSRKIMLCVWWDRRGIIHFELLNRNETVTADLYVQQLQRVHQSLLEKRPTLVNRKNVVLLHDNARPHTARVTQEFFWSLAGLFYLTHHTHLTLRLPIIICLDHCKILMWKNFGNEDQVREFVENFFMSKAVEFYAKGMEELPDKWQQVIANDGEYIID